jgi:hypothetical protein
MQRTMVAGQGRLEEFSLAVQHLRIRLYFTVAKATQPKTTAMRSIHLFSLLLFPLFSQAQDTLSVSVVRQYTYTFSLDSQSVSGPGWDSLQNDIRKSQFIILGENHGSPLLSVFTKHLLDAASKSGFKHFLLETGPVAARKVTSLYSPDKNVYRQRLHDFLSTFKQEMGSPPSEFVVMKTDVPMLQAAVKNKYHVVGLDKEYYSSIDYLLHELAQYSTKGILKTEYEAALNSAALYKKEELEKENYPYITHCKNDTAINRLLDHVSLQSKEAKFIADEMRKTFTIYGLYEDKAYYLSEEVRIANIKKNFGDWYYKNASSDPSSYKAIVKIGNVHSGRGMSYLLHFDIGNLATELAAMNGTRSTHINSMRRYRISPTGTVSDFYNNGYEVYPNIITLTDSTKWTIVDLRPLRLLMMTGKIKVKQKEERDLILQNDLVLLIPVDGEYKGSLNYD